MAMNWADEKVLVTGGTGFIGSHLVRELVARGARPFVLTRQGVADEKYRLWDLAGEFTLLEGDVRNLDDVQHLGSHEFSVVFHLAAYNRVDNSFTRISESFQTNTIGTRNVWEIARRSARFIHVSSSEVYGNCPRLPLDEESPTHPVSPYAMSKLAAEDVVRLLGATGSPRVALVRPFNTYGPFQSTRAVIPELILAALAGEPLDIGSGESRRDFLYVGDTVAGILAVAEAALPHNTVVVLASGTSISIADLAAKILQVVGGRAKIRRNIKPERPHEILELRGDSAKAQELVGWRAEVDFDAGLAWTIQWFGEYRQRTRQLNVPV